MMKLWVLATLVLIVFPAHGEPHPDYARIAGITWVRPGHLARITENGDIILNGWMREHTFLWGRDMVVGNFWQSSSDSVLVDTDIAGVDFQPPRSPEEGINDTPFPLGAFIVLLEDGRMFTRSAVLDSLGFRLEDRIPEEQISMRLEP